MARAFEFVHAANDVLTERGMQLPLEGQSTTDRQTRFDRGLAVQKAVFGRMIDEMYERSPKDQLHIQRFLSASCFGDYYTRIGLDVRVREMITLSILIALGGVESQIKGHIRGNLNVGNGRLRFVTAKISGTGFVSQVRLKITVAWNGLERAACPSDGPSNVGPWYGEGQYRDSTLFRSGPLVIGQ
jgi:alkylhydroperoxidase/carboxymuconolactone decarboxylase family protein YurZ